MRKAFTFVEQLLVVAIFGIIAGLSAVFYSRFLLQGAVQGTTDQLVSQLRKAQLYASSGKADSSWGVSYSGGALTLFATRSAQFNETFSVHPNVTITGLTTITFQKITAAPSASATITITGGPNSKTISVNAQGVVNQ